MGIISILLGMVAGAMMYAKNSARTEATKIIVAAANGVSTEYEVVYDVAVDPTGSTTEDWSAALTTNSNEPDVPASAIIEHTLDDDQFIFDDADIYAANSSERFIWAVWRNEVMRTMIQGITGSIKDRDKNGFLELRDSFEHFVAYSPGVRHNDDVTEDDFLPEHPRPYFASPGRDGKWGHAKNDPTGQERVDNIYSFDLH